jgi:parallel beta-helix repeat protein
MKKLIVLVLVTISLISSVFAAGQIDIAYSPYTINNPGSYIVVKDLTTALNLDGIDINTSNVTIDLNGHTLYGGVTSAGAGTGINDISASGANNVAIYNGTVVNSFIGIDLSGLNPRIERVNVSNNEYGIYLYNSGMIENCNISNNGVYGIYLNEHGASVFDCNITSNQNTGIRCFNCGGNFRNNSITNNLGDGISGADGALISGNFVSRNQLDGIDGNAATIIDNSCFENIGNGINSYGSLIKNNTLSSDSIGISAYYCKIMDNSCIGNTIGIYDSGQGYNTIQNNTLYNNTSIGINATGTHNFIAGNQLTNNTLSISTTTTGNTFGNGSTGFLNITY